MKKIKTNVLRLLDQQHIDYKTREYEYDDNHLSGEHIVHQVDLEADEIYKTLVLHDHHEYLVCCIPVMEEIDLKKLAKVSGHKSVEMLHQKDLLPLTGYMRGGCSPIGMKKKFPTRNQCRKKRFTGDFKTSRFNPICQWSMCRCDKIKKQILAFYL